MISFLEKYNFISWLITILIAGFIFYVSSLTFSGGAGGSNLQAIVYHMSIFFVLSFFLLISIVRGKNQNLIILAVALAFLYALSDEFHQYFVPGRASAASDIFLNSIGILFSTLLYLIMLVYRKNKFNNYPRKPKQS